MKYEMERHYTAESFKRLHRNHLLLAQRAHARARNLDVALHQRTTHTREGGGAAGHTHGNAGNGDASDVAADAPVVAHVTAHGATCGLPRYVVSSLSVSLSLYVAVFPCLSVSTYVLETRQLRVVTAQFPCLSMSTYVLHASLCQRMSRTPSPLKVYHGAERDGGPACAA